MHAQQFFVLLAAVGTTITEAHPPSNVNQTQTPHRPPAPRHINGGSFECNTARVRIVAGLQETRTNVEDIADAATKDAANEGINQSANAIKSIAVAIFSGQTPPGDARLITEAGLNVTQAALQGATSKFLSACSIDGKKKKDTSDPAVVAASATFAEAVAAAFDVVEFCT
ncbi:hypothetical protein PG997_008866 [Apiospora hydei]|uniref:Uncharacterized protein n=1 Tax=Apiospora hydei TaxID=1337664 RepID=A0ABR1WG33_9PEZI